MIILDNSKGHFERSHTPRDRQKSKNPKGQKRTRARGVKGNVQIAFVLSPARGFLSSRERFFFRFRVNARRWSFSKRVRLLEFIMTHKKCFFGIFGAMCWTFRKIREISVFCRAKQLRFLQRFLSRDTDFKRVKFVLREISHCLKRGGGRVTAAFVSYKHRTFWHVSLSPSLSRLAALLYSYT